MMIYHLVFYLCPLFMHSSLKLLVVRWDAIPLKKELLKFVIGVLSFKEQSSDDFHVENFCYTAFDSIDNMEVLNHLSIREHVVPKKS